MTASYGMRCLLARRLVESGVRFVQIFPRPVQPWDQHSNLKNDLGSICASTDQPSAALIRDLRERGLLESTIVIWTGEFGRLPITQNSNGRDHNRNAFSLILTGGGFKKGLIYGETDDLGYKSVVNRVSVPDLHATILSLLGLDHERVTYPHNGNTETSNRFQGQRCPRGQRSVGVTSSSLRGNSRPRPAHDRIHSSTRV